MSDASTRTMIEAYSDEAPAPLYLSSHFKSSARTIHNSEEVELDIQRDSEEVAVVIQDMTTGARANADGKFTNKSFKPPVFNEEGTITAFDMIKRQPGDTAFVDPVYQANATVRAFSIFRKLNNKVNRAIELMAAQVLQTGELALIDSAGVTLYTLDFQPKATHFPAVSTAWAADGATGDPLTDIANMAAVLRKDGRKRPSKLTFGAVAWQRFMANAKVKTALASIGMQSQVNLAVPSAEAGPQDATFAGYIVVQNYKFEMWLYDGMYVHPQTGVLTPYVADNKVIMTSPGARLDLSFGGIPRLVPPDPRALPFLPSRISGNGFDLSTYAWITPDGQHLKVSAGTRPLTIPVAIDTFGCITAY